MTDEQKPIFDEPEEDSADANAEATDAEADFGEVSARPPAHLERLQKILAQAGVASRRAAEQLILEGRVQVNGKIVTELGTKADSARDHIRVDGKLLHGAERLRYFVLNKPKGYVTTVKDPEGRPTVMEFFAKAGERLYPVGRLDYQSEGLLLITNDGPLANALTRAASGVEKTYLVKVAGQPGEELLERLRTGLSIDRGKLGEGKVQTAPARIRRVRPGENPWFEVVLIEGRNRELRKMFEEIGHHVEKIRRVGYGPLVLDVEPGKFRELEAREVDALRLTAAGKMKPKRFKATRMLPKEAGLSAELRTARAKGRGHKPFDRKPDWKPERRPEGKFDRQDDRAARPFRKPDDHGFTGRAEFRPRQDTRPPFAKPAGNFAGADRRPQQAKPWHKKPEGGSAERPPRREAPSRPFAGNAGPGKFGRSAPEGKFGPGDRGKPAYGGKSGGYSRPGGRTGAGPSVRPEFRPGARSGSRPFALPGARPESRPESGPRPGSWSGPKSTSRPEPSPGSRPGPRPGSGSGPRPSGPRPGGSRPGSFRPGSPRPGGSRAGGSKPGGAPRGGSGPARGGPRPGMSRSGGSRPGSPRPGSGGGQKSGPKSGHTGGKMPFRPGGGRKSR